VVDELVEALGIRGISKSEVSRICRELDEVVLGFKERPLDGAYPYVWLDATFPKVREGGRVRNMALVLAIGVRDNGEREVLGFELGFCEKIEIDRILQLKQTKRNFVRGFADADTGRMR